MRPDLAQVSAIEVRTNVSQVRLQLPMIVRNRVSGRIASTTIDNCEQFDTGDVDQEPFESPAPSHSSALWLQSITGDSRAPERTDWLTSSLNPTTSSRDLYSASIHAFTAARIASERLM